MKDSSHLRISSEAFSEDFLLPFRWRKLGDLIIFVLFRFAMDSKESRSSSSFSGLFGSMDKIDKPACIR